MNQTILIKIILSLLLCIIRVKSDCESTCKEKICKYLEDNPNEINKESSIELILNRNKCECFRELIDSCFLDKKNNVIGKDKLFDGFISRLANDKMPYNYVGFMPIGSNNVASNQRSNSDNTVSQQSSFSNTHSSQPSSSSNTVTVSNQRSNPGNTVTVSNQRSNSGNTVSNQQSSSGNTDSQQQPSTSTINTNNKQQSATANTNNRQQSAAGNTNNRQQSVTGNTNNKQQSTSVNTGSKQQPKVDEPALINETDANINNKLIDDKNPLPSNTESKTKDETGNDSQSSTNNEVLESNDDTKSDINKSPSINDDSPDNVGSKGKTSEAKKVSDYSSIKLIVIIAGVAVVLTTTVVSVYRRKANEKKTDEFKNYIKDSQSFLIEPDERSINPIISIDNKPYYIKRSFSDDYTDSFSYSQSHHPSISQSPTLCQSNSQPQSPYQSYSQPQSPYQFNYSGSINNLALPANALSFNGNTDEFLSEESMPWLYLNNNSQRLGDL